MDYDQEDIDPDRYVVWVGGVDDAYVSTLEEAEQIAQEWRDANYTDVIIEQLGKDN